MDKLTVHVEASAAAASAEAKAASAREFVHHVKSVIGVSVGVDVTDPGGVARSQGKAVRVVDNRPKDA